MRSPLPLCVPLLLLATPGVSSAIQLRWSTGTSDLTFTVSTRCTLVVEADPTEGRLPSEWRLLWAADGCNVTPVALSSGSECPSDVAEVTGVKAPTNPADRAANLSTAQFCSGGTEPALRARYVLDLPGAGKGRFKAVALDPTDSSRVVESQEAVFNGGVDRGYPPAILGVVSSHTSAELSVDLVGTSLDSVRSVTVLTPDSSWRIPLTIASRTPTRLAVEGVAYQALQGSRLELDTSGGMAVADALPNDPVLEPTTVPILGIVTDPLGSSVAYPKDFAFIYDTVPDPQYGWRGVYHVFYTRHIRDLKDDDNETAFVHAWTPIAGKTLQDGWDYDTEAFTRGNFPWDALHVWAPSIIFYRGLYYMFYTGVDAQRNQRIGFATAPTIPDGHFVWGHQSEPAFTADDAGWTWKASPQQFRDPFVMPDPDFPGRVLMFYTAADSAYPGHNAVGVARDQPGSGLHDWSDLGHFRSTDAEHVGGVRRLESPHAFQDSISAATGDQAHAVWRVMFTDGDYDTVHPETSLRFETAAAGASPSDTTLGTWSEPATLLGDYLGNGFSGLLGSEVLRAGRVSLFAAYTGSSIWCRRFYWDGTSFFSVGIGDVTSVGEFRESGGTGIRLALEELLPGSGWVRFRVELAGRMSVRLAVYDLMGRRIRTLVDGVLGPGARSIAWDGRNGPGGTVGSGVYFVSLSSGFERRVMRVPLLR